MVVTKLPAGSGSAIGKAAGGGVLVVEDDTPVRQLIARALDREGIETQAVTRAADAVSALRSARFDLVILDLRLPDADGLDLLARIRDEFDVPTIIVSGRGAEGDRVLGLTSGADDYVTKPFSPRELVARVHAVLRRVGRTEASERLVYGGLEIDTASHEVRLNGELIDVTPQEFDLLVELAKRPRRACTRDELLEWAWGSSSQYQDEATVTEHVRRIRHKIEEDPADPHWIVTVRGVGYRFEP